VTVKTLRLPPPLRRAIVAHAVRTRPRECCGLLVGRRGTVILAIEMPNIARGRTRYRVDDRAHFDVRRLLRRTRPRLDILGVYHSHPRGLAEPSPTDIALAMYSGWIHVIVGLSGRPIVRGYRLDGGRVTRVPLR
jgi:proteasome lid subunit RPN8/RPN11